jgi:uncharacterized membrane protein YhaH (DUF805 family)
MNFGQAITSGFRNYVNFSTRAPRSEYWFWVLFVFIVAIIAATIDTFAFDMPSGGPVYGLTSLALFLPGLAVSIRRLHDIDRTGWWLLIALTGVGLILLFVWACFAGTPGPNRFGPDPLGGDMLSPPRPA